jgi:hypothetical protein
VLGELLTGVGAARLAELLAESVHTQADQFAMVGRANDALLLRRYALVICRAAQELTATQSDTAP